MRHSHSVPPGIGWTLPLACVGGVVAAVGANALTTEEQPGHFCRGAIPLTHAFDDKGLFCGVTKADFFVGLAVVVVGLAVAVVGFACAVRRSRAAAVAGTPWPLHRRLDAIATWAEARLPRPKGRITVARWVRTRDVVMIAIIVVVAVAAGCVQGWHLHQRRVWAGKYHRAQAALAQLSFPAGWHEQTAANETNNGCEPAPGELCLTTAALPQDAQVALMPLLHASQTQGLCDDSPLLTSAAGLGCPVVVVGHLDGYPVSGAIFGHLLDVGEGGTAPAGAVPFGPKTSTSRYYFYGSDIEIVVDPP